MRLPYKKSNIWDPEESDKIEAKNTLTKISAMEILLSNDSFAAEIHIDGLIVGLSKTKTLIPVLIEEKEEINKFLNGEPNEYQ